MQTLVPEEFDRIYHIMEESFPEDERRPYAGQRALLDEPAYRIYTRPDPERGEPLAFLAVWDFECFAYIEHFAVAPAHRCGGVGSRLLRELIAQLGKPVCLEVEPPETEPAVRRIGFYRRCGFFLNEYPYLQPPLAPGRSTLPLLVMTTGGPVSRPQFEQIRDVLYARVYRISPQQAAQLQAETSDPGCSHDPF